MAHSKRFLVYTLLRPLNYDPIFCQVKDFLKIYNLGKFHQFSICGCQVKNFPCFAHRFSIHGMLFFGRLVGLFSPKYGPILSFYGKKTAGLRLATLLKKSLWHRCFPVNFAKFLRIPFLQNTSGQLLLLLKFLVKSLLHSVFN